MLEVCLNDRMMLKQIFPSIAKHLVHLCLVGTQLQGFLSLHPAQDSRGKLLVHMVAIGAALLAQVSLEAILDELVVVHSDLVDHGANDTADRAIAERHL